jgi:uncharacterized membrane protein YhaH (DUF805 family)
MNRLYFNLTAWPCFIMAAFFVALGNGNYFLDEVMNFLLNVVALMFFMASVVLLVFRLRASAVNAWFALLVVVPLGQLILMIIASFLPVKRSTVNE